MAGNQQLYGQLLRQVDLFSGLDRITLAKLASHLQPAFYSAGSVLFRQGEPGDAFFLVAAGMVGVYTTDATGTAEKRINVLGEGEPFGEMALLGNFKRTASIVALLECLTNRRAWQRRIDGACSRVTSATVALSGFASPSWVLVVSVLIIGAEITQTGILYRSDRHRSWGQYRRLHGRQYGLKTVGSTTRSSAT